MTNRFLHDEDRIRSLLPYTGRVKRLFYSDLKSEKDLSKLTLLHKLIKGPLLPNLKNLYLDIRCWPLAPTESSVLFGPNLMILELTGCLEADRYDKDRQWRNQTSGQRQQLCIHTLIKQSPQLQTFRNVISLRYVLYKLGSKSVIYLKSIITFLFRHPVEGSHFELEKRTAGTIQVECIYITFTTSLYASQVLHLLRLSHLDILPKRVNKSAIWSKGIDIKNFSSLVFDTRQRQEKIETFCRPTMTLASGPITQRGIMLPKITQRLHTQSSQIITFMTSFNQLSLRIFPRCLMFGTSTADSNATRHPYHRGKSIICPECQKKLTKSWEAKEHLMQHPEWEIEDRWKECFHQCELCDYYSIQKVNLLFHMKAKHKTIPDNQLEQNDIVRSCSLHVRFAEGKVHFDLRASEES
ncbi:hypothetical protein QCA50_010698 [Cerrena zonata]|uniref:C2H2-type domain-containing protein n=1 Tax=Cerrena zonata TaxID=2478898 RepID=A0AAW0G8C4_9APHY